MYLGLDLGTSGLRALLMDDDQRAVAVTTADYNVSRPHPAWSEQDPAAWIQAAIEAVTELRAAQPGAFGTVRGIGLSGQMHGATLVDRAGQVLRPAILWNDSRAAAEAAEMDADPAFRAVSGNAVFAGFTAPKLRWVARQDAAMFDQIHKVLLPKDYLRLWLTGDYLSDMSDASGTSWLEVGRRDWSDALLAATGLTRAQMPGLVEGSAPAGQLREELRLQWGLQGPVWVAGGAGDNAASAIGMGVVAEGEGFVSLGTSGVVFVANERFRPAPDLAVHAFCHALPDCWHQMGVILSATDALNWLARLTGVTAGALAAEVGDTLCPPGPITFLPYLGGERTPHNNPLIRGAFTGLGQEADRPAMTRAVMAGVAFALADALDALRAAGAQPWQLTAVGGGTRSAWWLESVATVLGLPLAIPAGGEFGAALGAARLAMMAVTGATASEICTPPAMSHVIEPRRDLQADWQQARARFQALYGVC